MTAKAHRLEGNRRAVALILTLALAFAILVHLARVSSRQPPSAFTFSQTTSELDYFDRLSHIKVPTRLSSLNDLGQATFDCDDGKREHCVFENICVTTPPGGTGEQSIWFTRNLLLDYDSQPFRLEHRGKEYFRLEPVVEANLTRTVHVIDEHVFLFNPLHANRFYVYARAFSLWVQTRSLSSDKPYHVMYFTPGRYNIMNNYEMLRPMTHQGAPLYMYPHSLADKEAVCFRRVEFQWSPSLTFLLTGPLQKYDELLSILATQPDSLDIAAQDELLRSRLPEFKRFMLEHMGVQDIPMERNRVLFVSRATAVKNHKPYRQILNEAELVDIMQEAGLEVDLVDYGMLSNEQQIVRTRRAAMFVGMHGAGMANLAWLHGAAPVLELHPYGFQKWGYERTCRYLGQPYFEWVNTHEKNSIANEESSKYASPRENHDYYRHRDQIVDPDEFRQVLQQTLAWMSATRQSNA